MSRPAGCLLSLFSFALAVGTIPLYPTIALLAAAVAAVIGLVAFSQARRSVR